MAKSRVYCAVPQCNSVKGKDGSLSFHRFPQPFHNRVGKIDGDVQREILRRKKWMLVLRIKNEVSVNSVVCSKHFQESDYLIPGPLALRRRLKCNAVPSLNLPVSSSTYSGERRQQKQAIKAEKENKFYALTWIPKNTNTVETLPTKICCTEVFNNISSSTRDTYLGSLVKKNITKLAVSEEDVLTECPAAFVSNIKIKTEEPWENNSLEENADHVQVQENKSNKERNEYGSSCILPSNKRSMFSKNKKYSEPSDDHREKIFGLLVASEMRTLKRNPVLYLKAKKQILETLSDAQMKFLNSDL